MIAQRLVPGLALLTLVGCRAVAPKDAPPRHYDIGVIHRTVSTDSPEAQLWFDRGLALCFGFNHEAAIACFERAAEADPDCAMAYWGRAYASGPNYNSPEVSPEANGVAMAALQKARACSADCTPAERALIGALQARHVLPVPSDRRALDLEYAAAMRAVRKAHPDDADVAALTGEALMQLRPWKIWGPDGAPAPETAEIRSVLEAGLARWPEHPALCHLYIHAMEAGPYAERALPAAQRLEPLAPGMGHLVHMPSHIYIWTGRYDDAVRVNQAAVAADGAFVEHAGRDNFYTLYRLHNYHFIAYGAMFEGRREMALRAARELVDEIPAGLLSEVPDFLDIFTATPYHVMVRFGLWDDILAEPEPAGELHAARAVWRYARGIALASLGRVEAAKKEQERFLQTRDQVPASRLLFNNPVRDILQVATRVLAGEVEYRQGNFEQAFDLLREAVALDLRLNYDEPWGWMEPARHALGALLLEQGQLEEAVAVYEANLERYPNNGWALHGLAEALQTLGRSRAARAVEKRFKTAWARADTTIPGSCFCRTVP